MKRDQRFRRAPRGDRRASTQRTRTRKRGIAITPVKFGISFTATFFNQAGALVLVYRDGSVQVNHGGTEMGQGLHTKIRQIAAESLGVPLESRAHHADAHRQGAEHVGHRRVGRHRPERRGRGGCLPPAAAQRCAPVAAPLLDCDPADGGVRGRHASRRRGRTCNRYLRELVEAAYRQRVPLFAQGYYRTPGNPLRSEDRGSGKPFHYFAYGAAVTEVEVDGFTGEHRVLRADILRGRRRLASRP